MSSQGFIPDQKIAYIILGVKLSNIELSNRLAYALSRICQIPIQIYLASNPSSHSYLGSRSYERKVSFRRLEL